MKKMYTAFKITNKGNIKDLKWNRYDTEQECFDNDVKNSFSHEIIILPVYVSLI